MDFKTWRNVNHREVAHIPNLFEKNSLEKTVSYIKQNIKPIVNTGQKTPNDQDEKYIDRQSWKIDNSHSFCKEFLDTLNNFIIKANNKHFQFDLNRIDGPYYVEYPQDGRTKLDWHLDIGEYPYNQRKLSFSLLVSDPSEYEGGNWSETATVFRTSKPCCCCYYSYFGHFFFFSFIDTATEDGTVLLH